MRRRERGSIFIIALAAGCGIGGDSGYGSVHPADGPQGADEPDRYRPRPHRGGSGGSSSDGFDLDHDGESCDASDGRVVRPRQTREPTGCRRQRVVPHGDPRRHRADAAQLHPASELDRMQLLPEQVSAILDFRETRRPQIGRRKGRVLQQPAAAVQREGRPLRLGRTSASGEGDHTRHSFQPANNDRQLDRHV